MDSNKFENYLYDLGLLFKEKAIEAKNIKETSSKDDIDYNKGYLMAFYEIIDLMKQQAKIFNIDEKDIGLADIDVDLDLF